MGRNKGRNGRSCRKTALMSALLQFFSEVPNKTLNYKQLSYALGMRTDAQKQLVTAALDELCEQGTLTQVAMGKYKINLRQNYVTGTLDRQTVAKKTYLVPDDGGEPVFVAERSMGCALNGDHVRVLLFPKRKGREQEGEVVEVLERAKNEFVGIVEVKSSVAFLNIDRKQLVHDLLIPSDKLQCKAKNRKPIGFRF